ncbi:methyl-accepting chemotaxis protein [Pandoraea sp. NPDC087047]|uniref:methyl-accepting chemotaxis protein n=1 Tax=Pandoraea sp. NPDC087047 TaxID=3364390 RepID=UPI003813325B
MRLSNLKVGSRLGGGIAVILVIMALMTGVSLWSLEKNSDATNELKSRLDRAALIQEWAATVDANAEISSAYMLTSDKGEQQRIEAKSSEQTKRDKDIHDQLSATASDTGKRLLTEIEGAAASYRDARLEAMQLKSQNSDDLATRLDEVVRTKLLPSAKAYSDAILKYRARIEVQAREAREQAQETLELARWILVACAVGALVLGALIGLTITRSIVTPVRSMVAIARQLAAGDLSGKAVSGIGRDELGDLTRELLAMKESWEKIVLSIRCGADTISTASAQIAAGNTDLSARTEEQAASLEETAASTEQLASTVKQNADNARQANQLAVGASEVARRGGEAVADVVNTMNEISESANQISEIVSVIDGIAFQTNILALNAAVEAARAGEQGKGFAVVAGEVRALAQRSATAAREIKVLIEASVAKVGAGAGQVSRAGVTMQEIVGSVKRVTDIIAEISAASTEQSNGIDQISHAVSQMDEVTQQNAALVEEAAAAANSLQDQARELVQAVSVFKVDETPVVGMPPSARFDRNVSRSLRVV